MNQVEQYILNRDKGVKYLRDHGWKVKRRRGYSPKDIWTDPVTDRYHFWRRAVEIQNMRDDTKEAQ